MSTNVDAPEETTRTGELTTRREVVEPRKRGRVSGYRYRRGWHGLRLGELVLLSVLIVDAFLALDFVFRATALAYDGFVSVVTTVGNALASPFAGIFGPNTYRLGHTNFWAALLALVVYFLAAMVVIRLLHLITHPVRRPVV